MNSKYKYAYPDNDTVKISKLEQDIRPAYQTEINITSLTKDELIGWITQYDCNISMLREDKLKVEDVEDEYIIEYKTWFGLGKTKKRVKDGWVRLKDKSNVVRYKLDNYKIVYLEKEE